VQVFLLPVRTHGTHAHPQDGCNIFLGEQMVFVERGFEAQKLAVRYMQFIKSGFNLALTEKK
jgi:hypothetical protein